MCSFAHHGDKCFFFTALSQFEIQIWKQHYGIQTDYLLPADAGGGGAGVETSIIKLWLWTSKAVNISLKNTNNIGRTAEVQVQQEHVHALHGVMGQPISWPEKSWPHWARNKLNCKSEILPKPHLSFLSLTV